MTLDSISMVRPGSPLYERIKLWRLSLASSFATRMRGGIIIEYPTDSSLTSLHQQQDVPSPMSRKKSEAVRDSGVKSVVTLALAVSPGGQESCA
jgi:hypothetical protein